MQSFTCLGARAAPEICVPSGCPSRSAGGKAVQSFDKHRDRDAVFADPHLWAGEGRHVTGFLWPPPKPSQDPLLEWFVGGKNLFSLVGCPFLGCRASFSASITRVQRALRFNGDFRGRQDCTNQPLRRARAPNCTERGPLRSDTKRATHPPSLSGVSSNITVV